MNEQAAHQLLIHDALRLTGVSLETGLSSKEAAERLVRYGANQVTARADTPGWQRMLRQFTAPLVLVLVAAALVTGLLGEWVDATVILIVVLQVASSFESLAFLRPYLVTEQVNAWFGLLRDPIDTAPLWRSVVVDLCWAVPCIAGAYVVFTRRDVLA